MDGGGWIRFRRRGLARRRGEHGGTKGGTRGLVLGYRARLHRRRHLGRRDVVFSLARLSRVPDRSFHGDRHRALPALRRPTLAPGGKLPTRSVPPDSLLGGPGALRLFRHPGFQRLGRGGGSGGFLGQARDPWHRGRFVRYPSARLHSLAPFGAGSAPHPGPHDAAADECVAPDDDRGRPLVAFLCLTLRPSPPPRLRHFGLGHGARRLRPRPRGFLQSVFRWDDSRLPRPLQYAVFRAVY